MRGMGLGTSIPTAALPGMGATIRSDGARIARARSSASAAMRPTFTPGPGATSYWVTTGPTVRPAIEPSTRNVCSVSISFWPICSICTSPASPSSGGAGCNKSIGGMRTPAGTCAGLRTGALFCFRSFGKRETGSVEANARCGGSLSTGLGLAGFSVSRFPIPVSRVRSATSGCHPTVRMPSAESANTPISAPPAVPTARWMACATRAGATPTSRWVGLHRA